jgi:acetoin utilization deacetylase AcuC-like enzyme
MQSTLKVFYNENQNVVNNDSFSPSAGKPKLVVERFKSYPSVEIVSDWLPLTRNDLYQAHDKDHVDDVLECKKPNGFSNYSEDVAASLYWTTGSIYNAAKHAVKSKTVTMSPTSGFHHATHNESMAFCTFNGLMIAIVLLKNEKLIESAGIIDFDMHYGNGTEDIINKLNIDYLQHIGSSDIIALAEDNTIDRDDLSNKLNAFKKCSVLLYQAGADPHINDPLGGKLTTEQMIMRDRLVFTFAKENKIPLVWNLAGGYQNPIENVIDLHENTLKECLSVYKLYE